MNFLETIFANLSKTPDRPALQEVRDGNLVPVTCRHFLMNVRAARAFVLRSGLRKGDRCALLAQNSPQWIALDLALMAEGIAVVPLYARQTPAELVAIMKDCAPAIICSAEPAITDAIREMWEDAPPVFSFAEVFNADATTGQGDSPIPLRNSDLVTIIYTSGTSGEAKGVPLTVANLNHMIGCTTQRLNLLMDGHAGVEQIFHYLPFCFAGSWILLLSALSRNAVLTLSTDLTKLADELKVAAPNYMLNVPALLERVRKGVEEKLRERGGFALKVFDKGGAAFMRKQSGRSAGLISALWLLLARKFVFPAVRIAIGPNLKALICGSAPLALDTQLFFTMLGIPVLQVYGLTETTAICTMDDPRKVEAGWVGPAIVGTEMKLSDNDEIIVRGPHVFLGYWNRPRETAAAMRDGWFHTGDQGEVNAGGNWRIVGRLKNLIILNSGHNIAPEPIEERLLRAIPGAQQVMVTGNGRSFLAALLTGSVSGENVAEGLNAVNTDQPHYKRIHAFHIRKEPFTVESGLLTANGKLRRDAIAAALRDEIEEMYGMKERAHST